MFLPRSPFCQEAGLFLQVPREDKFPQQASRSLSFPSCLMFLQGGPGELGAERGQWSGGLYVEGRCWEVVPSVPSQFVITKDWPGSFRKGNFLVEIKSRRRTDLLEFCKATLA